MATKHDGQLVPLNERAVVAASGRPTNLGGLMLPAGMEPPPAGVMVGIEDCTPIHNWVSLDNAGGVLVCKSLDLEFPETTGRIFNSRAVRVMTDRETFEVVCESSDRRVADEGTARSGMGCADCPDRGRACQLRWQIAWEDEQCGAMLICTLSQTASYSFQQYMNELLSHRVYHHQVETRIKVVQATRKVQNTKYHTVDFEMVRLLDGAPGADDFTDDEPGVEPPSAAPPKLSLAEWYVHEFTSIEDQAELSARRDEFQADIADGKFTRPEKEAIAAALTAAERRVGV